MEMAGKRYLGLALALFVAVLPMGAQTPAVSDAAPVVETPRPTEDVAPYTNGKIGSENAPLTPEQIEMLQQRIDVGTIDINRLREIVAGISAGEPLRLSLEECIRITVEQNPDLQVVRLEELKSDADIFTAKGEFDPALISKELYLRATQETSPEYRSFGAMASVDVWRTTSSNGVQGKLRTGTLYSATLDLNKEETTFNDFIEEWSGGLTLTLSQPLLKGRGVSVNTTRINIAKNARQKSELQLRLSVMNTVAQVVKSYWDLVGTIENVSVREQALANAERLLDISQKRLNIGTAAAIEVLQAKAGVATRQSELIAARSQVSDAEDALKQVMNLREGDIFSARHIVPTDRPSAPQLDIEALKQIEATLENSINEALAARPEILTAQIDIKSAELERKRAANDMLPQVDVAGTLAQGARNHYMTGVFEGIRDRNDNSYTVGFNGSVPIGNRAARGAYQRASLTVRQAEQQLEKTKQQVMLSVRMALRAMETSQILIESNQQARKLQETNVAAEEKRLRLGVSTSYQVLQVQQDLSLAQTQEVQSQIGYQKAMVDLRLAEGDLLDALGVEFAPPEPEKPIGYFRSLYPKTPAE
jgi:outer membrane protein TolC